MGESWAYDLLIIDAGALPASNALGLIRNVLRDPNLDRARCLLLLGDEPAPGELAAEPRAAVLPRRWSEGEFRDALLKLLGASDPGLGSSAPRASQMPQMQVDQPAGTVLPLGGHVLLVEDNPVNRQVAQRLLSLIGLSFVVAENGKEALDQIQQQAFDAVLMDCQMPVMDGYTATRIQRQNEGNAPGQRLPIIAMTANAMAGDREKCLNTGMDDYMSKPLNRALLEQTLRRWLPAGAKSKDVAAASKPVRAAPITPAVAPPAPAPAPTLAQAATAAGPESVLDSDVVRDLLDVMGDEFTDLVQVYLEDTPKALAALEQAAARGDNEGLIAPSHSLKSTSANLGALGLAELAKRLEHGARGGTLGNEAPIVVAQIKRTFQRVTVELNSLLAKSAVRPQ
jgi:CheY-like chemotaxis protein/HPt (histidine-containing phosphotransfer) domain-containing protein